MTSLRSASIFRRKACAIYSLWHNLLTISCGGLEAVMVMVMLDDYWTVLMVAQMAWRKTCDGEKCYSGATCCSCLFRPPKIRTARWFIDDRVYASDGDPQQPFSRTNYLYCKQTETPRASYFINKQCKFTPRLRLNAGE